MKENKESTSGSVDIKKVRDIHGDVVGRDKNTKYNFGIDSESAKINSEILKLVKLLQDSKDISDENKKDATQALNSIADQVKENKGNKLTLKGTLTAVQDVVSKAADIAVPGLAIISTVFKLLRLG